MSNTVNRDYPYPRRKGDGADVAYWLQQLAEALDTDVQSIFGKFDTESPRFYSPLQIGAWTIGGSVSVENITTPTGPIRRVGVDLDVIRTAGAFSLAGGGTTYSALGILIPPQARLASGSASLSNAVGGGGINATVQSYVDYKTGNVQFRAAGPSAFTFPTNAQFSINLQFSGTPAAV